MTDHPSIIESLGGLKEVAATLGLPPHVVRKWAKRGRIPVWHWDALLRAFPGRVTAEQLTAALQARTARGAAAAA